MGRSATMRPPRRQYTVSIRSRLLATLVPSCRFRASARANLHPALQSTLQGQLFLAPGGPLRRYPVHLQRSSLAHARHEPVIRMLVAAEGEQDAALGRHLGRVIVYVVRRADQTQPAAGVLPLLVEIDEDGDDFHLGIVMHVAVLGLAILANRDLQRMSAQIDAELGGELLAHQWAPELFQQRGEGRAVTQLLRRKVAGSLDLRIVSIDLGQRLALYEMRDDYEVARIFLQRRTFERLEVENRHVRMVLPTGSDLHVVDRVA